MMILMANSESFKRYLRNLVFNTKKNESANKMNKEADLSDSEDHEQQDNRFEDFKPSYQLKMMKLRF